ncbi:MAG: hypothetical protein WCK67_06990 [bacterium]
MNNMQLGFKGLETINHKSRITSPDEDINLMKKYKNINKSDIETSDRFDSNYTKKLTLKSGVELSFSPDILEIKEGKKITSIQTDEKTNEGEDDFMRKSSNAMAGTIIDKLNVLV